MHICAILFVLFMALSIAGILADFIAPKHPSFVNLVYNLIDKLM